jgi:hypothetical protein
VTDEIWAVRNNPVQLRSRLNDQAEFYSVFDMINLSATTERVRLWCLSAIAQTALAGAGNPAAIARVKKWFGDPGVMLPELIRELHTGFIAMRNCINQNHLIYVDVPADRGNDGTYAFVWEDERLPNINVKRLFFNANMPHFPNQTYWAVTILHELSHRVVKTDDHKYDHAKLTVKSNYHPFQAINNADAWAYYAGDCHGSLTPAQIQWARG